MAYSGDGMIELIAICVFSVIAGVALSLASFVIVDLIAGNHPLSTLRLIRK